MHTLKRIAGAGVVFALVTLASACVIAPREGYWDRDHHRYYHEHAWHDCNEHAEFCR